MILNIKSALFPILSLSLLMAACHKNTIVHPVTKADTTTHDVYVAGTSGDTAVYWKNGKEVKLSDGTRGAFANSIFVTNNNDVYIAGTMYTDGLDSGPFKALSWKNGVVTNLDNNPQSVFSEAYAISVLGNDVYVGGYTTNGPNLATYWKNGTPVVIGGSNSTIYSLSVNSGDVYTSGESFVSDSSYATYWKNGQATVLGPGSSSSIFITNNNIYTAGYQDINGASYAACWQNQTVINFDSTSGQDVASCVFVSGNDVYVAGYHRSGVNMVATYWKNGVPIALNNDTNVNSWAQSICVVGNDVYVAGVIVNELFSSTVATVWKNGVATKLGIDNSAATAVFVK